MPTGMANTATTTSCKTTGKRNAREESMKITLVMMHKEEHTGLKCT
jgi:hypothetical protein